jgi:hypothetical protein
MEEEEVAVVGYMNSADWWTVLLDSKIIGRAEEVKEMEVKEDF